MEHNVNRKDIVREGSLLQYYNSIILYTQPLEEHAWVLEFLADRGLEHFSKLLVGQDFFASVTALGLHVPAQRDHFLSYLL